MLNRREMLTKAACTGAALAATAAIPAFAKPANSAPNPVRGFNANNLNPHLMKTAVQWAAESGTNFFSHNHTQGDIHQAAMAYRLVHDHLAELNFHRAAAMYLLSHAHTLQQPSDATLTHHFNNIRAAGFNNIPRSRFDEVMRGALLRPKRVRNCARFILKHPRGAEMLNAVAVRKMQMIAEFAPTVEHIGFSMDGLDRRACEAKFKRVLMAADDEGEGGGGGWEEYFPTYGGDEYGYGGGYSGGSFGGFGGFGQQDYTPPPPPDPPPDPNRNRLFSEKTCFYAGAALYYGSIVSLAIPGWGEAAAVVGILGTGILYVGGC